MKPTLLLFKRLALPGRPLGTALMRGDQLAGMIRPHLTDLCDVRILPFHARVTPPILMSRLARGFAPGSIVVFVKTAARDVSQQQINALKEHGVSVGLDVIDMPLAEIDTDLFDFYVAASIEGQRGLQSHLEENNRTAPVYLIHHHADPRIAEGDFASDRRFACAFLGLSENAIIPAVLKDKVTILHTKTGRDFEKVLPQLGKFTLHYAVRPSSNQGLKRGYKPFTKGFTAAACGAAILVNRDVDDAEALLGADYPFFVDHQNEATIVESFERAAHAYGGPVWTEATARVAALKEACAPASIVRQMRDIIKKEQERQV